MSELPAALHALAVRDRVLVACDLDGTIAEFIHDPADVVVNPVSVAAMATLAGLPDTAVAVVSGRPYVDLVAILQRSAIPGVERFIVVGGHGVEIEGPPQLTDAQRQLVGTITSEVRAALVQWPLVIAEPKVTGVSVHSRALSEAEAQATDERLHELVGAAGWGGEVFIQRGLRMFEVLVLEPNKGAAVAHLRERQGAPATAVLYAGDDLTDETVFSRLGPGDVGIHVGAKPSAAEHRIGSPADLAALLHTLAGERERWLSSPHP